MKLFGFEIKRAGSIDESILAHDLLMEQEGNNEKKIFNDKLTDARDSLNSRQAEMVLSGIFEKISRTKQGIIKGVDDFGDNWLVDALVQQLTDDSLTPDITTGDILDIQSRNRKVKKELEYLDEKFGFDTLITDFVPDMIRYGEYTYSTKIDKSKGLTDIYDDVDQTKVIAMTKLGVLENFLTRTDVSDDREKIQLVKPGNFIMFTLSGKRLRLDLHEEFGGAETFKKVMVQLQKKIPRYVRIGRSFIYPVIDKIKELRLLETLVPASKLYKLAQGSVIGVTVPGNMAPDDAYKVCKKVESLINKSVAIDQTNDVLSVQDILATAGRTRVVPNFGGDRGYMNKMDYKMDEPEDMVASIRDIRESICTSFGVPSELIFNNDGSQKGELLKRYARYLRKLKSIQKGVVSGVRHMVEVHLVNKGIDYRQSDIQIEFRNKLIEIDNIDSLEFTDTSVNMIKNVKEFLSELAGEEFDFSKNIDKDKVTKFLNDQMKIAGMVGMMNSDKYKGTEENEEPLDTEDEFGEDEEKMMFNKNKEEK